ncbi:hypothetical protein SCP_0404350 [Sparassis crispa]|uniref:Uncharacterized protein n=1 Tax=Sparassis crispa TaxID=139825 RepID=A0A401GIQ3_9APHY|nr:hypothetical protein SCP_0404350 [Sparassis crispa]GBE82057.1 hypothetical protein SCP_0404350 [Sparassis crispa]
MPSDARRTHLRPSSPAASPQHSSGPAGGTVKVGRRVSQCHGMLLRLPGGSSEVQAELMWYGSQGEVECARARLEGDTLAQSAKSRRHRMTSRPHTCVSYEKDE